MVCTKRHTKNSPPTSSSLYIVKEFVCCTIKPKSTCTSLSLRLFESRHRSNRKPLSVPRLTRFPEWFAKKWMTTHSVDFSKENTLRLRSTLICQKYASHWFSKNIFHSNQELLKSITLDETSKHCIGFFLRVLNMIDNFCD